MWNPTGRPEIKHPLADELYQYLDGVRFDPGAAAETFVPLFELPVLYIAGRGKLAGQFQTIQPPQVIFLPQAGVAGLGGVQAGQIISQPLLDPNDFNTQE